MKKKQIISIDKLGFTWKTSDPFLFCVHHYDKFPRGNGLMGPDISLSGRNIGNDFSGKDGFSMYHGDVVPGFPSHPHRGFETVTIMLEGYIDHSDSFGETARYGEGDVQWMTAGSGLQHAEMMPLLDLEKNNTTHLFQIWLNSPKMYKMVTPFYKILWNETIPVITHSDKLNRNSTIRLIAGSYQNSRAVDPAPKSWANTIDNKVGIWIIKMEPNATFSLPALSPTLNRTLYFYQGSSLLIDDTSINVNQSVRLVGDDVVMIENQESEAYLLLLEGEPIGEPVVQYGPFVMNTDDEIKQAIKDYKETNFGGWPWNRNDPVHARDAGRFAKYKNGTIEYPIIK